MDALGGHQSSNATHSTAPAVDSVPESLQTSKELPKVTVESPSDQAESTSTQACPTLSSRMLREMPSRTVHAAARSELLDPETVTVREGFVVKQGAQLTDSVYVGNKLGGGVQGAVYDLVNGDGAAVGLVLKVVRYRAAASCTGFLAGLEREWYIGRRLNELAEPDGHLPGFMRTGAALMSRRGKLCGLVLEKLYGYTLARRLFEEETGGLSLPYLLQMLEQVLGALARAERRLRFVHGDLHLGNIMESRLDLLQLLSSKSFKGRQKKQQSSKRQGGIAVNTAGISRSGECPLEFKIIDYGHARIKGNRRQMEAGMHSGDRRAEAHPLPRSSLLEKTYRIWWWHRGDVWRLMQDLLDVLDGRVWPEEAKSEVEALVDIIYDVTGVRIRAWFAAKAVVAKTQFGWPWQRFGGPFHILRRMRLRLQAYVWPRRGCITAEETVEVLQQKGLWKDALASDTAV